VILAEQKIEITRQVNILKNKLMVSQDGNFIFLVFVDSNTSKLWKTVVLDALALNNKFELEYDLTRANIHCLDVKHDPHMVRLKDNFANQIASGLGIDPAEAQRY
jgi:hypothetical protein